MICAQFTLAKRIFSARVKLHFSTSDEQSPHIKRQFQQAEQITYRPGDNNVVLGETASYNFAVLPEYQRTVLKQKDLFIHHAWTPASLMLHNHLHLLSTKMPLANRRLNYTAFQRLVERKYEDSYKKCTTPSDIFHMSRRVAQQMRQLEDRVGIIDLDPEQKVQYYPVWRPFRQFLSRNTQKNYESKGVPVELLGARVFPIGKVWMPTRQNYLELLDKYLSNKRISANEDTILDVGCGSGVLSFVLAKQASKNSKIIGLDINPQAVKTANMNATRLKIENFKALEFNINDRVDFSMFAQESSIPKEFSLIISNPPWIVAKKLSQQIGLEDGVYDEKQQFLNGLLAFTKKYLKKDGRLLLFYSTLSQQLGLTPNSVESVVEAHGLRVSERLEIGYLDKLEANDPLGQFKQRSKILLLQVRHPGR